MGDYAVAARERSRSRSPHEPLVAAALTEAAAAPEIPPQLTPATEPVETGPCGPGWAARRGESAQWMVGKGKGNKIYYRDCDPDFQEELEKQFLSGKWHSHFTWKCGPNAVPKTFEHDLRNMFQRNTKSNELKVLRRVVVLNSSRLRPSTSTSLIHRACGVAGGSAPAAP